MADTPLMQQYENLKLRHPREIVFFRLGDFYEMFGEDALKAAPILEVALTHRQKVPMCGVPYHAADRYMAKLLKKGHRIAIAEQLEEPSAAKGLVKRGVTRVISNGTLIEDHLLTEKCNNYLVAVYFSEGFLEFGLAYLDVSTGEFRCAQNACGENLSDCLNEISHLNPAELLLSATNKTLDEALKFIPNQILNPRESGAVSISKILDEAGETLNNFSLAKSSAEMILRYLERTNPEFLNHLKSPEWVNQKEFMVLDAETLENLEILKNSANGSASKTLLEFLDQTLTPMGGRRLRQWLTKPLLQLEKIKARNSAVTFFVEEGTLRQTARAALKNCADLERILSRIVTDRATPRELVHLKNSLVKIEQMKPWVTVANFFRGNEDMSRVIQTIENSIVEEAPATLENGGAIKDSVDADLDEKRKTLKEGNRWLEQLEEKEREQTSISTLRLGYTSVFGYYLEVTKAQLSKVPGHWHRKQTLINTERFISEELKNLEGKILGAQEQSLRIEKALYQKVLDSLKTESSLIRALAQNVAELDCLMAFAEVAEMRGLTQPQWTSNDEIVIKEGWHPVVKESLPLGTFVPNNTQLNSVDQQIIILTGPNMAGKSTYLRQVALILFMAQIGCYVSAAEAKLSLVDRIFTRIGSGDRLAQGQSTFMVEMAETSKILKQATDKSLIILDEVGRGTSTYDGISIAWSVIEYLAKKKGKVLFATHYFELTQLSQILEKVKNYNVEAKEYKDTVIFLHKISPGTADRSYGIHVAQLAGLPLEVIQNAKKILEGLELEHKTLLELNRSEENPQTELFK